MEDGDGSELQLTVPDTVRPGRADKILAILYPDLSRSRWQRLFGDGRVWMDDRALCQKDKIRPGDSVQFSIPPDRPMDLQPVDMNLSIHFEDADLLVLEKEPGVVVHPGSGTGGDTLVHGLLHHCKGSLGGIGGTERPGIVHRLDKETSGLLVVAKSEAAFRELSRQFAEREVGKGYTALVTGVPDPPDGMVDQPIARHPVHRTRMACRAGGRTARTDYRLVEAFGREAALLSLRIHTGRTHQIRVHMKHIGHPLAGDGLYGYKAGSLKTGGRPVPVPRVLLHATRLAFKHPVTGRPMGFESPLPPDFSSVLDLLRQSGPPGNCR